MAINGMMTPLRKETMQNLQLNAGIFLKNLTVSKTSTATAVRTAVKSAITAGTTLLGATRGGGTFTVTRDMRIPDIDGMRYRFVGGNFVDSVDAYLSTTLVEVTKQNFIDLLGAHVVTADSGDTAQQLKMDTVIPLSAYIENLCWVGELSDGGLVCIYLDNALNTADFSLTFADKNEGTLAVELHACQDEVNDYDEAPFHVWFLSDATT